VTVAAIATMIITAKIETAAGMMTVAAIDKGICSLVFEFGIKTTKELSALAIHFGTTASEGENHHISMLRDQLKEYFNGNRKNFTVSLEPQGTPFQHTVWNELLNVKYGTTRTYLEQSAALGNSKLIRSVAYANSQNRILILIPCHRIIGSDGRLTGYAGGLWRKKWLLDHERKYSGTEFEQELFDTGINFNQ
jgi:AraC family transcriptional regulator, regulatory protein of adaptative response / methylated-DNA-[protein]-cysteine methyltransferase